MDLRYVSSSVFMLAGLLMCTSTAAANQQPVGDPAAPPAAVHEMSDEMADSEEAERVSEAIETLTELTAAPDNDIPDYLLERAEAIVVIPSLIKGGFIVGGKHGKGVISVRDRTGDSWSAPAFINMTGGSIGWQIGAETVDLVLLVMDKGGVEQLLQDRFTLGGSLSATAGPVGRTASAATNAQLNTQILAYSRSQGLFAGATFEGAALHADHDANEDAYGEDVDLREIVSESVVGLAPAPAFVAQWQSAMARIVDGMSNDMTNQEPR